MFEIIKEKINPISTCGTYNYDVKLDKTYTVREFIATILTKRPREWGYVGIHDDTMPYPYPKCNYYYGKREASTMTDDMLDKTIESVTARGNASKMNYTLVIA